MKTFAIVCALLFALLPKPCRAQTAWQKVNSGTTSGLKGVYLVDTKDGYAAGSGPELRHTTDGGVTWSPIKVTGATQDLWGVFATHGPAGDSICVVGDNGSVFRSTNGGANWVAQDMHYSQGFAFAVTGTDSRNMYVTGYEGTDIGLVIVTHDGGQNWNKVPIAGAGTFDKSFMLTSQLGYAVGGKPGGFANGGLIEKTTDGGLNWTTAATTPYAMNSIYCFDENNWSAVGYNGLAIRTTDGGKNWKKMTIPAAQATDPFTQILFIDSDLGFISSALGPLLKTTDGGDTWTRDNTLIAGSTVLWSMAKAESETETVALTVCESGSIFRYRVKKQQPQPAASLSDNRLDFDSVLVGSKELSLTISPANQLGLRVDSAYIDAPANGFTLLAPTGPFPIALQTGDEQTVTVRFTHDDALGTLLAGTLVLVTNDPAHPTLEVPLNVKQKPTGGTTSAVLSTTSLAFGKVGRDSTKDMTFTLTAAGTSPLHMTAFSIENETVPGTFTVTSPKGPFPVTVQPGTPLTITVRFKPVEIATEAADLYITTDQATGGDLHVALGGEGIVPVASVGGVSARAGMSLEVYPNPTSTAGTVRLVVPMPGHVRIALFDMLGRESRLLYDGASAAGERVVALDAAGLPNGRYTCVARANGRTATVPVTIAR